MLFRSGDSECALPISAPARHHPHLRLHHLVRSEERRVGKSVDLGGRRIIKKKKKDKRDKKRKNKSTREAPSPRPALWCSESRSSGSSCGSPSRSFPRHRGRRQPSADVRAADDEACRRLRSRCPDHTALRIPGRTQRYHWQRSEEHTS